MNFRLNDLLTKSKYFILFVFGYSSAIFCESITKAHFWVGMGCNFFVYMVKPSVAAVPLYLKGYTYLQQNFDLTDKCHQHRPQKNVQTFYIKQMMALKS